MNEETYGIAKMFKTKNRYYGKVELSMAGTENMRVVDSSLVLYRVTKQLEPNLPLTSKLKFHFGMALPHLDRPKWNFCFDGRFGLI